MSYQSRKLFAPLSALSSRATVIGNSALNYLLGDNSVSGPLIIYTSDDAIPLGSIFQRRTGYQSWSSVSWESSDLGFDIESPISLIAKFMESLHGTRDYEPDYLYNMGLLFQEYPLKISYPELRPYLSHASLLHYALDNLKRGQLRSSISQHHAFNLLGNIVISKIDVDSLVRGYMHFLLNL